MYVKFVDDTKNYESGPRAGQKALSQNLQGAAEVTWCVQLGEEKVEG